MGYVKTLAEAEKLIAALMPFNAGTLTANWEQYDKETKGYVVRSYGVHQRQSVHVLLV